MTCKKCREHEPLYVRTGFTQTSSSLLVSVFLRRFHPSLGDWGSVFRNCLLLSLSRIKLSNLKRREPITKVRQSSRRTAISAAPPRCPRTSRNIEFSISCMSTFAASCTMGTGSFSEVKSGRAVTLTPHPLLVPWSRKIRTIPLHPLWAVRPVQSLRPCTRVHFTFLPLCLLWPCIK